MQVVLDRPLAQKERGCVFAAVDFSYAIQLFLRWWQVG